MNILVLTPDRVGSTLLQRVTTVFANINERAEPLTVNLHELTNGLTKYQHPMYNREILTKSGASFGYHQKLEEIVDLLSNAKHDKIARLAHYHIRARGDTIAEQLEFYKYLNDNFFIISCRRQNIFEHALSWSIVGESKKLNVFSTQEKHDTLKDIHKNGINIHPDAFTRHLNSYQEYLEWVDRHFMVNAYFEYERDMPNIEQFVLGLSPFNKFGRPINWFDKFDIEWNDWNRMHYLQSLEPFDYEFTEEEQDFMAKHRELYQNAQDFCNDLMHRRLMMTTIPIKLHTLREKATVIKNASGLLETYNQWARLAPPHVPALTYSPQVLEENSYQEQLAWHKTAEMNPLLKDYSQIMRRLS